MSVRRSFAPGAIAAAVAISAIGGMTLGLVSGCSSARPATSRSSPTVGASTAAAAPAAAAPAAAAPPTSAVGDGRDDRLGAVLWMQTSAEYRALALSAFARARAELDLALKTPTWTAALEQTGDFAGRPPAVIVDVDETMLDNSPYEGDRIRAGQRYDEASWHSWVDRATAEAIPGALDFARYAAAQGVTVFYVTNRAAMYEEATRTNLRTRGFPVATERDTVLLAGERPEWTSDKGTRRTEVAREFRILLLVGDDLGDFVSGARALPDERVALAERYADRWQERWILIPNAYYGSWERALSGNERGLSDDEVLRRKMARLRGSN
ncbi:MAG: HAD family acid phosphatase [Thermoanaerobaculia bacterium]